VEVATGFYVTNYGDKCLRIYEFFKRDIVEIKLTRDAHHHAIEAAFSKSTISANP
jgi:hypothetical protein